MGLRGKKPDPRRSDNKANNNQSTGSSCNRCGGSGTITTTATDAKGNTIPWTIDCPSCN